MSALATAAPASCADCQRRAEKQREQQHAHYEDDQTGDQPSMRVRTRTFGILLSGRGRARQMCGFHHPTISVPDLSSTDRVGSGSARAVEDSEQAAGPFADHPPDQLPEFFHQADARDLPFERA